MGKGLNGVSAELTQDILVNVPLTDSLLCQNPALSGKLIRRQLECSTNLRVCA